MRYPIRRLLAVVAAAILCLSPIAFATAADADVHVDVGYAQVGGVQLDDSETWTAIALSGVFVIAVVGSVLLVRRRHHHGGHVAHPA